MQASSQTRTHETRTNPPALPPRQHCHWRQTQGIDDARTVPNHHRAEGNVPDDGTVLDGYQGNAQRSR